MRFENIIKQVKINKNYELIKDTIPKPIRDKIKEYKPNNDLRSVEYIEFESNLTMSEKTQLLNLFPELKEV